MVIQEGVSFYSRSIKDNNYDKTISEEGTTVITTMAMI
jgi:hypothetical protein